MFDKDKLPLDAERAFRRYEEIRPRLPEARYPAQSIHAASLADLADEFDVFVLDAYGVLNVGARPVAGAPERLRDLKAAGKSIYILTNGASFPLERSTARYRSHGFDVTAETVIASREAALTVMAKGNPDWLWGVAATPESSLESLENHTVLLEEDSGDYDRSDAFLLLSSIGWTFERHASLLQSLKANPRPIIVGNPDLIAPQEGGFSLEPGFYAHDLMDRLGIKAEFHGKPFPSVFDLVKERLPKGIDPARIAMVGDTLHTDILGGAAAGWRTILVTGHGLFRGADAGAFIKRSGIVPDYVVETT